MTQSNVFILLPDIAISKEKIITVNLGQKFSNAEIILKSYDGVSEVIYMSFCNTLIL